MAKQRIEIEVDIPEGYEATGEFRIPRTGEPVINGKGKLDHQGIYESTLIILRKKEPLAIQACRAIVGGTLRDAENLARKAITEFDKERT